MTSIDLLLDHAAHTKEDLTLNELVSECWAASLWTCEMASGFPARFAETRAYQLQDEELSSFVKEAFDDLGWRCEILSRTEFRARTPFMFLGSWGERLKVEILLESSGGRKQEYLAGV